MKQFIIISALGFFCVVHLMAQLNENKRLPWDSIPPSLPPFEMERTDTLRFNPGDTIPAPIWEKFLRNEGVAEFRTLNAPLDKMPVIVPPDHQFQMIVVVPDTTFYYYMRNPGKEERKTPAWRQQLPGRKKRP